MENYILCRICGWLFNLNFMVLLASAGPCNISGNVNVDCSYLSLHAIPNKTLPNTTHSLNLGHNVIRNIPGYAFHFLTILVSLDLSFNRIKTLDRNSFVNLSKLESLDLNSNDLLLSSDTYPLGVFLPLVNLKFFHVEDNVCRRNTRHQQYPVAMSALKNLKGLYTDFPPRVVFGNEFSEMTKLETLSSSGFYNTEKRHLQCCVQRIQHNSFFPFRNIRIRHLRLTFSCLKKLHPDAFQPLRDIDSLELEGNRKLGLHGVLLAFRGLANTNITHVSLGSSNTMSSSVEKRNSFPNKHLLKYLNTICTKSLDISGNYLHIGDNNLTRADCLETLSISKCQFTMDCVSLKGQSQTARGPNILEWNCTKPQIGFFLNTLKLTKLSICQSDLNFPGNPPYYLLSIFKNMHHLEHLDICDNQLTLIPQDMLLNNANLQSLRLTDNSLTNVPTQVLKGATLEELDLSYNRIQWLTHDEIQSLEAYRKTKPQFQLTLFRNPLLCSCESIDFVQWLNQTPIVKFVDYLYCTYPNGSQVMIVEFMRNFKDFSVSCESRSWLYISVALAVVATLVLMCFAGYYRRRWNIHYWFYSHCKPTEDMLPEQNYDYDAFVAYNHNDSAWVHHSLREALEAPNTGLRLCLHHRDFEAGQVIQQNIVDSINNSRKVIIVISHEFIKSTWGEYEIEMAAMRSVQEAITNMIVCVLLEEIPIREMPRSLLNLWQRVTFLAWPESVRDQDLFWDKLLNALQ